MQLLKVKGFDLDKNSKAERVQGRLLKVSKFRKQIMVSKLLPKNKSNSLSWKITTKRESMFFFARR